MVSPFLVWYLKIRQYVERKTVPDTNLPQKLNA